MVWWLSRILIFISSGSMETVMLNIQSERDIQKIYNHGKYGSNVKDVVSKAKAQKIKLTIPKILKAFET